MTKSKYKHDFRSICSGADQYQTTINFEGIEGPYKWVILGATSLQEHAIFNVWTLKASLQNYVDAEHDSVVFLRIPIVGLKLKFVHYGTALYEAHVLVKEPSDFSFPSKALLQNLAEKKNPLCESCKGEAPHFILPEKFTDRKENSSLIKSLNGKLISIYMSAAHKEEISVRDYKDDLDDSLTEKYEYDEYDDEYDE